MSATRVFFRSISLYLLFQLISWSKSLKHLSALISPLNLLSAPGWTKFSGLSSFPSLLTTTDPTKRDEVGYQGAKDVSVWTIRNRVRVKVRRAGEDGERNYKVLSELCSSAFFRLLWSLKWFIPVYWAFIPTRKKLHILACLSEVFNPFWMFIFSSPGPRLHELRGRGQARRLRGAQRRRDAAERDAGTTQCDATRARVQWHTCRIASFVMQIFF